MDEKKQKLISDEIANRLPNDEFLSKPRTIERIVELMNKGILKSQVLNDAILSQIQKSEKKL